MIIQRELWLSALHGLPLARQILFLRQRPLKNLAIAFPLTFFWESTVRCRPIVIVARAFAFVGCASCIRRWHFFYADLRGSRLKNRNALLSYWPLYLIGNASIKARPSYSKPRLCHIFFQWVSLATVFGKGTETEYSDKMPTKYEFTWVVRAGSYCILEFFDNSSVELGLIRVWSFRPKRNSPLGESYVLIFAPTFARGWPLRSVSTAVTFTSAFSVLLSHAVGPILPRSYLNSRSTLSQAFFTHSLLRRFIASFNSVLFFFFCLDEFEIGSALFPPFEG